MNISEIREISYDVAILKSLLKIITDSKLTTLDFDTSRSSEVIAGEDVQGGVTLQGVRVKDLSDGQVQWYQFVGIGAGVGVGPLSGGVSFSTEEFSSCGTRVLKGSVGFGKINFDDLVGLGMIIELRESTDVKGTGVSLILFNIKVDPLFHTASLFTAGTMLSTPGVGVMVYRGYWYKVDK